MITVKIGEQGSTTVTFPCSDNVLNEKLKTIGLGDIIPARAVVAEVIEPAYLQLEKDRKINLDELNYLAKRLESFVPKEIDTYAEIIRYQGYCTPADLINATFNLNTFTLVQDVSNLEKVGYDYMLSKNGCLTEEQTKTLDFAKIGRELLSCGRATVTERGLLFRNQEIEMASVYDGIVFPEYDYSGSSLLTLEMIYKGESEYVYLPDDDLAIAKAVNRLGAEFIEECQCEIGDISTNIGSMDKILKSILENEDAFALNKVATAINNADMDLNKLSALIEYADATEGKTISILAENIDKFVFIKDCEDLEDVGRYFVENDGDYTVNPELEDFIKYDEFGEYMKEQMEGEFTSQGYVSMKNNYETLESIYENYPSEDIGMGSI